MWKYVMRFYIESFLLGLVSTSGDTKIMIYFEPACTKAPTPHSLWRREKKSLQVEEPVR